MLRESSWRIVWDPAGAATLLLDYGDLMDSEAALDASLKTDVGRPDFSAAGIPVSRGNASRRLRFSRRIARASAEAAWIAALEALAAAPWGLKKTLRVTPLGTAAQDYTAALLTCSHRPDFSEGLADSVHVYDFRATPI